MIKTPADDDVEYITGDAVCSFAEMLEALSANGAVVERGLITDEGRFLPQAND